MDPIQKLFVVWIIICVVILILAIVSLVIALDNKRKIKNLENSS